MKNGIGYIQVVVTEGFKQEYMIALAKKNLSMKNHIISAVEQLIIDTTEKKVKK